MTNCLWAKCASCHQTSSVKTLKETQCTTGLISSTTGLPTEGAFLPLCRLSNMVPELRVHMFVCVVCSVEVMSVMNETENVEVLQLVNTSTVDNVGVGQLETSSVSFTTVPRTGMIFSPSHVCICSLADI